MISNQAIIHPSAKIGVNVEIGPWTFIGKDVEIGDGCWISSHVVIKGTTKIGKNNKFYQFSSIGEDCQDKKYHGEPTSLVIGDSNVFREGSTVHRGTLQGGGETKVGNFNLFMANSHVAHDCNIGNDVIFANGASVAGHVTIHDHAILGGLTGVHQFCSIGSYSFAAGGAIIYKDVLPYVMVSGYPAEVNGINTVGLERHNFSSDVIASIKKAYKIIFRSSSTTKEAIEQLKDLATDCKEVQMLSDFLLGSTRGIVR